MFDNVSLITFIASDLKYFDNSVTELTSPRIMKVVHFLYMLVFLNTDMFLSCFKIGK